MTEAGTRRPGRGTYTDDSPTGLTGTSHDHYGPQPPILFDIWACRTCGKTTCTPIKDRAQPMMHLCLTVHRDGYHADHRLLEKLLW